MPESKTEAQNGHVNKLSQVALLVNTYPLPLIIIFLILRMYQVEANVSNDRKELNKRAVELESFNKHILEKGIEQEDRRIKIRETELNIKYVSDSTL